MMSRKRPADVDKMFSFKVDGLTSRTNTGDLKRLFERYGRIDDVHVPRRPGTNENKGFGFVRFYNLMDAFKVISASDGVIHDGQKLSVQPARYGPGGRADRCLCEDCKVLLSAVQDPNAIWLSRFLGPPSTDYDEKIDVLVFLEKFGKFRPCDVCPGCQ